MGNSGTPGGRFQRAIERRELMAAEAALREMGFVSLGNALQFLLVVAAKEPERFDLLAARWVGRFACETNGVDLADLQLMLGAVAGLREPARRIPLETIAALAERFKLSALAADARRAIPGGARGPLETRPVR